MAEQENILTRLGKLFQNQIVVRKTDSGRLRVKDVDLSQTALTSNFIDRYTRLMNSTYSGWSGLKYQKKNASSTYDIMRNELFRDYELMDEDPIISSALDIYSDESTVTNVERQTLKIKSNNTKVASILHNLFHDILNIEFNLWSWTRNMCKYGDFYLMLNILDKHGVVGVKPLSPYDESGFTLTIPYLSTISNCKKKSPYFVRFLIQDHKLNSIFIIS